MFKENITIWAKNNAVMINSIILGLNFQYFDIFKKIITIWAKSNAVLKFGILIDTIIVSLNFQNLIFLSKFQYFKGFKRIEVLTRSKNSDAIWCDFLTCLDLL